MYNLFLVTKLLRHKSKKSEKEKIVPRVFLHIFFSESIEFLCKQTVAFYKKICTYWSKKLTTMNVKSCKIVWCILNLVRVLYNLIIIFNYFFVDQANLPLTKKNFFLFSQWWENLNLFEVVEKYLTFCGVAIENCQNFTTSLLEYKKNQGNGGHTTLSRDIRASFRKNMSKENFFI